MDCSQATDQEIASLLAMIEKEYGYDFRSYSQAHIRRRITNRLNLSGYASVQELKQHVERNRVVAAALLRDLSITVTEMFRDPDFFRSLRSEVIPVLQTYPFIKIWHAGCSTGQEAYSMAILLKEEGLLERTTIYATDFNQEALDQAREGIYPSKLMKEYTLNYQEAGGEEAFSNYYRSSYEKAIMSSELKKNIVWANHNLVTDAVFAEVHMVLCRNVLIYFDKELQEKVHHLFFDSLIKGGFLCLGNKEGLKYGPFANSYQEVDGKQKIFKKRY